MITRLGKIILVGVRVYTQKCYNIFKHTEVFWGHLKYNAKKTFELAIANIYSIAMQLLYVLHYYFISVFMHIYVHICMLPYYLLLYFPNYC